MTGASRSQRSWQPAASTRSSRRLAVGRVATSSSSSAAASTCTTWPCSSRAARRPFTPGCCWSCPRSRPRRGCRTSRARRCPPQLDRRARGRVAQGARSHGHLGPCVVSRGQVFDVIGLDADVVARCFPAAGHWPGRIGLDDIGQAVANRHRHAFQVDVPSLPDPGLVRFRGSGESHAFAPTVVKALRTMVEPGAGLGDVRTYLATVADGGPRQPRDLLAFRPTNNSLPIDDVEPASRIVRRFVSSAMSLGALSPEAHQAISIGMHRLGASANSGEGERIRPGTRRRPAVTGATRPSSRSPRPGSGSRPSTSPAPSNSRSRSRRARSQVRVNCPARR